MASHAGPNAVEDGLILALDAGNTKSYPGSGTTWTDLSGNGNNGTLVNGVGYNSDYGGSLSFDGTNDYIDITSLAPLADTSAVTMEAWVNVDTLTNSYQVIGTWERTTYHWQFTYSGDTNYNLNLAVAGSNDSVGTTSAPATLK